MGMTGGQWIAAAPGAVFILGAACAGAARAEEPAPIRLPASWAALAIDSAVEPPRPARPDDSREIEARKSYAIPAAEILAFQLGLNLVDRGLEGDDYKSTLSSIRRNLRSSWKNDRDPFLVNQLGHPYQGSIYHGAARSAGLDYWEALAYTFAGSALWEIAGEKTPPSRNDQINTGIGGTFLGEALFRMANLVLEHENMDTFWREAAAAMLSPPVGVNRYAFGDRFRLVFPSRDPIYFARLQLGFGGGDKGNLGSSTVKLKRGEALADFNLDYGLPGKEGYGYTRPFDLFTFQATASSANGFENVMTRGLVVGKDYRGERYRGVWGLYGSYDYIAPQTYRVSTTAVSLGTTAQWQVSQPVSFIGTALLGVGYAAAGTTLSAAENDFHYGVAPQALGALRAVYRDQWAIDVTAREWYVSRVAAAGSGGHENITRIDAALTYRMRGRHAVSLKYLGNRRAEFLPGLGDHSQRRSTVGIFYTLLGHDRFGAVEW